jgi:cytochrome oxidase assembly protein ShyY1
MAYATRSEQSRYQREWVAKRRADYLADKSCVVCGTTQSLEVDHIDPAQKSSHRIWTWSDKRRNAELAKCQILCTDHHKMKTRAQRPIPEHGTVSRYSSNAHKCRCELCRKANRERAAVNKAKKKIADHEQARLDLHHFAEVIELSPNFPKWDAA